MMARFLILSALAALIANPLYGQIYSTQYRAPGQNWMEIQSDRFRIIYPDRYRQQAVRSMAILESDYADIQELVGGKVRNFPFIINPENDRSNGFVSPMNFRSEIELAPSVGKSMNPQSGDWLELVLPHELVHVLHFNVNPSSFTRLLGLFSPDMRRGVHSAAPLGVFEGIAVQHESHGSIPHSGRGNHPYFTNKFNAHLNTGREWSMGQLLHVTDFTPPFDRHYIGGYEFTNWLLHSYGSDAMKEAIEFHYKYPFLGFGTALRNTTGHWPRSLYRQFSDSVKTREKNRLSELEETTDPFSEAVIFRGQCRRLNRPLWLDHETILFYARSCNRPSGFYLYHKNDRSIEHLHEVIISPDVDYSLGDENSSLYFSRYHTDRFYDNLFQGDLHRLNLDSGRSERITQNRRLISPEWSNGHLFARQVIANETQLVRVDPATGGVIHEYQKPEESLVVQAAVNPQNDDLTAVIGRLKSVQAVWFEDLNQANTLFIHPPDIVFDEGSVFDLSWHPSGESLLFVSDYSGTMNVYEYEISSNRIKQITESLHNAFEPSYSPDGETIAYIGQKENEQKLYVLNREEALNKPVPKSDWIYSETTAQRLERPLMNRNIEIDDSEWEFASHHTGFSWLKPRLWLPEYERESGMDRIGIHLESVDVMSRQSYSVDVNHYADRFWYSAEYNNKRFYPGFNTELFNRPNFVTFQIEEEDGDEPENLLLLQQSVGGSFKVPVPIRLESNARFTSMLLEPQYFLTRVRFLDADNTAQSASEFGTRHTVGFRTVFNYRMRQFTRDVQPNSGWSFFAEGRYGLNRDEIQIESGPHSITGNLAKRKGLRAGVTRYIAPLSRWNQSLRMSARVYSQTTVPVFNLLSQFSDNFAEIPLSGVNNAGLLDFRYTIPLTHPDDGGLLVPLYLSNLYLVLFSQTVTDLNQSDWVNASRSVYGAGIRSRFRLSNMAFDIGISIGWEPTRNEVTYYFGNF